MVSYAIITRLRRTAVAVAIASAVMLVASLAQLLRPAGLAPQSLSGAIHWNGWIATVPEGTYTFTVAPGGAARLAIDGRMVADGASATPIHLDASPRAFDFEDRRPGSAQLDVRWSRDGAAPAAIPPSVLFARKPRALALTGLSALRLFDAGAQWLWVLTLVACVGYLAVAGWALLRSSIAEDVDWRWVRWIVLGSIALNAVPIWWGLPSIWPPDELTPSALLRGLGAWFSHGWFDRWPPFHYYVLTAASSPVLLLHALGRIDVGAAPWPQVLVLIHRSVSVAAAAGTLIAISVTAARVFGRRAALVAPAIFALALPFPYYAKTANLDVPYVFWFAVSLVFYFRTLQTGTTRDAVAFSAAATVAICTKDQAYALYPLMAAAIAVRAWRTRRIAPLLAGGSAAAVIFALSHNLLFNWSGFVSHVQYIVGPGSENYRAFAPTFGGRIELAGLTGRLIKESWGWPLTIVCAAGVAHALFVRRCAAGFALVAPLVSYYLFFVNVILYNYDRFVLPMTVVLSIFGGFAIDRLLSFTGRTRSLSAVAVGTIFAYSVLYAATLDALMLRDSRYIVARWAAEQVRPGDVVGVSGPRELEPAFTVPYVDVANREDLDRVKPAFYVLSADYARAVPLETGWGQLIASLQNRTAGYSLAARVRCPSPWPWLPDAHPELVGPRAIAPGGDAVSVLRDIDPTLEIYARGSPPRVDVACTTTLLR